VISRTWGGKPKREREKSPIRETGKNRGLKREAELILDTSMGTEAEAIQSSPRFFLVSPCRP
jgi:hypothetical protein